MPYSEILFSRNAEEFYEELFLSNFSDQLIQRLATGEDARDVLEKLSKNSTFLTI